MGNQREIRQVLPRSGLGAILRVRAGQGAHVKNLIGTSRARGNFYTYFCPAGEPIEIPNMDTSLDLRRDASEHDHVAIQSGGKMWCGYERFVAHVGHLAPLLEDAQFFVGDEEDYIDEFMLIDGQLRYRRVHQGGWWDLEDFLTSRATTPDS
jgi:hypothetical protein